jgi:alpha,alpha-trehalase
VTAVRPHRAGSLAGPAARDRLRSRAADADRPAIAHVEIPPPPDGHDEPLDDALRTPHRLYGALFVDVQMQRVLDDGKTFVDAVPKRLAPADLRRLYDAQRRQAGFSLARFVHEHFDLPAEPEAIATLPAGAPLPGATGSDDLVAHIHALWPSLVRDASGPSSAPVPGTDTRLWLPAPYVVPGGRFRELYYWDSFFTMLGLVESGERALAEGMLRNFASLLDRHGHVPNGSRTYFLSRSQPPFFHKMVEALGDDEGPAVAWARHLPQLLKEHAWWMQGEQSVAPGEAARRVVRLKDGGLLNRYWDSGAGPREESWRDDVLTAADAPERVAPDVWRDLRAGAESGWDFSSRWCADPQRLSTIETTSILPVDLNALMWSLERAISLGLERAGDRAGASEFALRAAERRATIDRLLWDPSHGHFVDYQWRVGEPRRQLTAAAVVPLYLGLANPRQADLTARAIKRQLLGPHGLLTTAVATDQQWDSPNGWAPLQWMAVEGLHRHGEHALARTIAQRWVGTVRRVWHATGRLLEKYDVMSDRPGGGGEYPTQDGFGWTNASVLALRRYGADGPA